MGALWPSRRNERGIVGLNLVLVVGFAFYAVIMLSRTTLAANSIDDHVKVIVEEIGPGSNISRLEETQQLDSVGATAERILAASRPLSGQTQEILDTVRKIDTTAAGINGNVGEINSSVRSIGATTSQLLPVVEAINGQGSSATQSSGVAGINLRADAVLPEVAGIRSDLAGVAEAVGGDGTANTVDAHVNSINCALASPSGGLLGAVGGLLGGIGQPVPSGTVICR